MRGASGAGLPVIVFDAQPTSAEEQFELFHDTTAPVFDTLPSGSPADFSAQATDYLVGDVVISRIAHAPQSMRRSIRHIRCGSEDALAVLVYRRGRVDLSFDRTEMTLDSQHVGIIDLARSFYAACTDIDSVWAVIPRRRLRASLGRSPCARLHRDSPRGRVLRSTVISVWNRLPNASAEDATTLAQEIIDATQSVLTDGDFAPSDTALAVAMSDFVIAHLDDLDLDARMLARTFHCSRSTLFRIFAPHGGVAACIRDARLDRCLDELLEPYESTRTVHQIATRWGFENPSHFHRLFTTRYGTPPSTARGTRHAPPGRAYDQDTSKKINTFHQWATR